MSDEVVVRVEVTDEHIKFGQKNVVPRCLNCPIGLALHDLLGEYFVVTWDDVRRGSGRYPLPREARQFVADADLRRTLKPFAFDLKLPAELVLKGGAA